jgi:hypothetical protein
MLLSSKLYNHNSIGEGQKLSPPGMKRRRLEKRYIQQSETRCRYETNQLDFRVGQGRWELLKIGAKSNPPTISKIYYHAGELDTSALYTNHNTSSC